jgi:hypothetical protein
MSLFGGLKKAFKSVARAVLPALPGIGGVVGGIIGGSLGDGQRYPALPGAGFQIDPRISGVPGYGQIVTNPLHYAGQALKRAGEVFDPTTGKPIRKRRRMNPMNPRAARRAIRRIKAVRRITRDIERSLPKQAARRRAA